MKFDELGKWIPRIEEELRKSYAAEKDRRPEFAGATDLLEEFTLRGGKRFRALLVLAGYHMTAHRDPTVVVPAAAALEHFQSWMLIHDDIIDHAETRRGGPTLHRELEQEHARFNWAGTHESYGMGGGITLGDLEEPYTVDAILSVKVPDGRRLRAVQEYVRMTRDTAYGQLLDIRSGVRPVGEVREEDVLNVHRLKTSVYTVAAPLRIGAILGGAGPSLLQAFETIGGDLGVAFQLRDDVLGAGFDGGQAGKSTNDILEGKRTLLIVKAWSELDADGRRDITTALGNPQASHEQVERVRDRIRSSGSLAYSEAKIDTLAKHAFGRIEKTRALKAPDKALLKEIGERLVHRST